MKTLQVFLSVAALALCAACGTITGDVAESASTKNLNADGYMMLVKVETASDANMTPESKIVIGRVSYKSRKVGIPASQKVPTAAFFKRTKTKTLLGTEEDIIEFDFTAATSEDAKAICNKLGNVCTQDGN